MKVIIPIKCPWCGENAKFRLYQASSFEVDLSAQNKPIRKRELVDACDKCKRDYVVEVELKISAETIVRKVEELEKVS